MISKETQAWDRYWKRGEINSCISASQANNQKDVTSFWQRFFKNFENDAVLLDVGTGNGLLPLLAVEVAQDRNFSWEIHGIDLSDINPEKNVAEGKEALEQVNFQGRIAAEDLPFAAEYFDGITSQYAIEYGNLEKSIPEIARVLKKGGRFCAVLHIKDSIVVAQNNKKISEVDFLLSSDVFHTSKRLLAEYWTLKVAASTQNVSAKLKTLADEYIFNIKKLKHSFPADRPLTIIPQIQQGLFDTLKFGSAYPLEQNLQVIDRAVLSLKSQKIILDDLVHSALDNPKLESLVALLSAAGFDKIEKNLFYDGAGGNLIGIWIKGQKI